MQDERRFGADVPGFVPPPWPGLEALEGRHVRLERLDADKHAADLFRAFSADDAIWDYLPYGPFASASAYHRWAKEKEGSTDPAFYAIRNLETGHCGGVASLPADHARDGLHRGGAHLSGARGAARRGRRPRRCT